MTPDASDTRSRNRILAIIGGVLVLLIVVGSAFLFWYLNQPVPDEVSLESAVEGVANSLPPNNAPDTTLPDNGLDGLWTVDTSVGQFSFEDATASFVGFRIDEELVSLGATTAVGRTPVVEGSLDLTGSMISEVTIKADLTQIVTNASRRDRAVQRALATDDFPVATFGLTAPIDIGAIPAEGEPVPVIASGELEIKGVVRPIEIPLDTQLAGDLIVVVGGLDITFADWGVEMPTSPGVVSVEDHGILEIQLFFSLG